VEKVVAESIERLAAEIEKRRFTVTVVGPLPTVWGNRVRLREAIVNILSNAVKFGDKQPATIQISAETTEDICKLAIADNGPGIPPEDLDRIFSPFRRLRIHQDRPGTGLGLYFTRNLVEQDGGSVWAESQIGKGSVFYITLKRHS
jgi:signal transduction histidine kinase